MSRKREIERKFLVHRELLPELPAGKQLVQGYLAVGPTVRVRTESDAEEAGSAPQRGFLTIKGTGLVGRDEFEYEIPFEEATALLRLAHGALISKTRYRLPAEGFPDLVWELDVFSGENDGLVVAEIELGGVRRSYPRPPWLAAEVSQDAAYKNATLSQRPFSQWKEKSDGTTGE